MLYCIILQIVSSTYDEDSGDNYELNFSSFSSIVNSRRISDTNTTDISINTNTREMEMKTTTSLPATLTSTLTTSTSNIMNGTIPEEQTTEECLGPPIDGVQFDCKPSAEAATRYQTIRNNMIQMGSVPMPVLSVAIESVRISITILLTNSIYK